jgi:DNA-binding HxlR family transcriptional regulator
MPPRLAPSESSLRSGCPIAAALDVVGDRWTLLIVRDLLLGKTKYNEFLAGEEGIPTNILAERLRRLQKLGLIEKAAYQDNPTRYAYALTVKGRDLRNAIGALAMWSKEYVPSVKINETLRQLVLARR